MQSAVAAKDGILLVNGFDLSMMASGAQQDGERDATPASTFHLGDHESILGMRGSTLTLQFLRKGNLLAYRQILEASVGQDDEPHIVAYLPEGKGPGKQASIMYANQSNMDVGAALNDIVGGSLVFGATGGQRLAVVLHDSKGAGEFTDIEDGLTVGPHYNIVTASGEGETVEEDRETNTGFIAQLHVLAVEGDNASLEVTVEHSEDGDNWEELVAFDPVTTRGSRRKGGNGTDTVKKFVRAVHEVSGDDPEIVYALLLARVQ